MAAAIVSGLPLNVPTCSYTPVAMASITSAVPPIGPARHAAAERLGEAHDVGHDAEVLDRTAGRDGQPGLDLVERQQRPVGVEQRHQPVEVAGRRGHDTDVHHHRLDDHPGDLTGVGQQHAAHRVEATERHDVDEGGDLRRDRPVFADRRRLVRRAAIIRLGVDGDLQGVVVPVVAALDLDDVGPSGDGPHQVDGGQRRLGAAVGEAPHRQAEAPGQLGGDRDDVGDRLGEVGAVAHPLGHRGDDGRVGVAGEHRAEAAVEVDVLGAVDVPDPRASAALDEHRARRRVLPGRGDASREVGAGRDVQLVRSPGAGHEGRLLRRDQGIQGVEVPTADLVDESHVTITPY